MYIKQTRGRHYVVCVRRIAINLFAKWTRRPSETVNQPKFPFFLQFFTARQTTGFAFFSSSILFTTHKNLQMMRRPIAPHIYICMQVSLSFYFIFILAFAGWWFKMNRSHNHTCVARARFHCMMQPTFYVVTYIFINTHTHATRHRTHIDIIFAVAKRENKIYD